MTDLNKETLETGQTGQTGQTGKIKSRKPKRISVGVTAALAVGGIALATQQVQALSALAIVNGITSNGGVGVSKNILYGDEPNQDLDIYYPKPLTKSMKS